MNLNFASEEIKRDEFYEVLRENLLKYDKIGCLDCDFEKILIMLDVNKESFIVFYKYNDAPEIYPFNAEGLNDFIDSYEIKTFLKLSIVEFWVEDI